MDSNLSFGHHMNAISKYAYYHLRRIAYIIKYFSRRINRKLINALVLSPVLSLSGFHLESDASTFCYA